jgi:hypothetical protein
MTELMQCEECDVIMPEDVATVEHFQGHDGLVTVAFCPDCSSE